jgi:hypothetical protein
LDDQSPSTIGSVNTAMGVAGIVAGNDLSFRTIGFILILFVFQAFSSPL